MTSREGRQQWAGELPVEVVEAMREADEPMWKVASDAVRMYLGVAEDAVEAGYERRLENLYDQHAEIEQDIEELKREKAEIEETIASVEANYEDFLESQDDYKEILDEILESLRSTGTTVYAHKDKLTEAAIQEYGKTTSSARRDVIDDLKSRRNERNLALDDSYFTEGPVSAASAEGIADGGSDGPSFSHLESGGDDD